MDYFEAKLEQFSCGSTKVIKENKLTIFSWTTLYFNTLGFPTRKRKGTPTAPS